MEEPQLAPVALGIHFGGRSGVINPAAPQIQGLKVRGAEPGSAPTSQPCAPTWPVPIPGKRAPIPAPTKLGHGCKRRVAPMGGSRDGSIDVLWLPAPQSSPPHQHPRKPGQPRRHPVPGGPPPCTPMYLPAEGPAVSAGWQAGCRVVLCRAVPSGTGGAAPCTPRLGGPAGSPAEHPALSTQPWRSEGLAFLRC